MDEASAPFLRSENDLTEKNDPGNDRILLPDKNYHVFISYSSKDGDFVQKLHIHLERKLKFKCMLADHHFTPGISVIDNISNSIDQSLFVVFKSFLDSGYCGREVDLAFTYAMDNRQKDYVIILKLDDSELDRKLRDRTYINGSDLDIESIGRKFEMAFTGNGEHESSYYDESCKNGKVVLQKYPVELSPSLFGGMEYVFPDLSEEDMEKLRGSNIEDSATCYNSIKKDIHRTRLLSQYALISLSNTRKRRFTIGGIFLGCLAFLLSLLFFLYWSIGALHLKDSKILFWIFSSIVFLPLCMLICLVVVTKWQKRIKIRIREGLQSIALAQMKLRRNKYIIFPVMQNYYIYFNVTDLHITFLYYDINPCWKYFKERVEWSNTSEERINEWCDEMFKQMIIRTYFENKSAPITNTPRHPTSESVRCFCQSLDEIDVTKYEPAPSTTDTDLCEETCVLQIVESEGESELHVIETGNTVSGNLHGIDNVNFESTDDADETHAKMAQSESHSDTRRVEGDITLSGGETLNLNDIQLFPLLSSTGESTNQISQDEELCFRDEKNIDEETYAKTCV